MIPIYYLLRLYLELRIWYIIVEEDAGKIDLPSLSVIHFELYRRTFDAPHMSDECDPPLNATAQRTTITPPQPLKPTPTQTPTHYGRTRWNPPT